MSKLTSTPIVPPCPVPALPPGTAAPPPSAPLGAPLLHTLPLPPPQPPEGRDAKGRFAPGNPGGTPGRRHKVTQAMESMMEGQWEALSQTALQMALRGDSTMLKACLDRLAPVRRGSGVTIPDFPRIETSADVPKAQAAILAAVTAGHLTADEAKPLSELCTAFITALDVTSLAERLTELEKQIEEAQNFRKRHRGPV